MSPTPRVLSVGQCSADDYRLARLLESGLGARMDRAASADAALQLISRNPYDLLLINRIFDADGSSGLAFIPRVRAQAPDLPLMLVSDYPEAQAQALVAGALPGFGKSALSSPQTLIDLRQALAPPPRTSDPDHLSRGKHA